MSSSMTDPAMQAAFDAEISAGVAPNEPIDLNNDGGVMKTILKEGEGWERPNKGINVAVHYTGTLLSGEKFDSSVDRGEYFRFDLGMGNVIKGWDICVASMRRGEKCKVVLAPQYAYGAQGSPPTIPPNSTLVFEIELFEFDNEIDISSNKSGTLKKLETKAGEGFEAPQFDGVAQIQYEVLLKDGSVCQPMTTTTFTLGDDTFPAGIQFAISTLRVGSAARFTVQPVQAYGLDGNPALNIPAGSTTVWNIELLGLANPPDPSGLEPAQKLAVANEKKTEGNALFAQRKLERAIKKYDLAASYTKFIPGDEGRQAQDLAHVCQLNAAQCSLNLQQYQDAERRCTSVLNLEPTNIKALYRRALALHAMQQFPEAAKDLSLLIQTDSSHQEAVRELARVNAKIKAQEDKERAVFSKMFV